MLYPSNIPVPTAPLPLSSLGGFPFHFAPRVCERSLTKIQFNRERDLLFTTSKDKSPFVWFSEKGERLGTYEGHKGAVWSLDVSYDSRRLVTGGGDNRCILWDTETGKQLANAPAPTVVRCVGFSYSAQLFFYSAMSMDQEVRDAAKDVFAMAKDLLGHRGLGPPPPEVVEHGEAPPSAQCLYLTALLSNQPTEWKLDHGSGWTVIPKKIMNGLAELGALNPEPVPNDDPFREARTATGEQAGKAGRRAWAELALGQGLQDGTFHGRIHRVRIRVYEIADGGRCLLGMNAVRALGIVVDHGGVEGWPEGVEAVRLGEHGDPLQAFSSFAEAAEHPAHPHPHPAKLFASR